MDTLKHTDKMNNSHVQQNKNIIKMSYLFKQAVRQLIVKHQHFKNITTKCLHVILQMSQQQLLLWGKSIKLNNIR